MSLSSQHSCSGQTSKCLIGKTKKNAKFKLKVVDLVSFEDMLLLLAS